MNRFSQIGKVFTACVAAVLAVMIFAGVAGAETDRLHLKDGRVLEGRVEREGNGFVYFVVRIGAIEQVQFFTSDEIKRLERSAGAAASRSGEQRGRSAPADRGAASGAKRVAVLNYGPPSAWQGEIGDMVGLQISVKAFEDAVPLLKADGVDVVVIRINSPGGLTMEVPKFHELFENEYKPNFRTVAWVESAISAAAMAPYVLEEFYFMPEGNMGASTEFTMNNMQTTKGVVRERTLYTMERASRLGGRDPAVMRSMQIMEPLSATIDEETGEVTWYQDLSGDYIVNPENRVLTINATQAVKFGIAKGIASTLDELMQQMGIEEYEVAGRSATDLVDRRMRDADFTVRRLNEVRTNYEIALQLAAGLPQGSTERGGQLQRARRFLRQMRQMVSINPNFEPMYGMTDEWFEEQEERIRRLQ